MSEPVAEVVAVSATLATAFIQAMGTDLWEAFRSKISKLLNRHRGQANELAFTEQAAQDRQLLMSQPPGNQEALSNTFIDLWTRRLAEILSAHPDTADEFTELIRWWDTSNKSIGDPARTTIQTVEKNRIKKGNLNIAGRDIKFLKPGEE